MYLHECYLVPKGTLDAIVKHLEDQPYKTAAPLLTALNNLPNCAAESVQKAGLEMHPEDTVGWVGLAEALIYALHGVALVRFGPPAVDPPSGLF